MVEKEYFMATIYFAKVNYNNMHEIYHEKRSLQEINKKVFSLLNINTIYKKIKYFHHFLLF